MRLVAQLVISIRARQCTRTALLVPASVIAPSRRRFSRLRRPGWLSRIYVSVIGGNRSEKFRCCSAMGKIRGTQRMLSHFPYIVTLPNIFLTRLFSKQRLKGRTSGRQAWLGAGGPRFKSGRPDHFLLYFGFFALAPGTNRYPTPRTVSK